VNASEDVIYGALPTVVVGVGFTSAWTTVVLVALISSGFPLLILFLAAGCFLARAFMMLCYRAVLHANGELEFASILRRRLVTSAGAVHTIKFRRGAEGDSSFTVVFDGGKSRLSANKSARRLVDRLLALNPAIECRGYERRA